MSTIVERIAAIVELELQGIRDAVTALSNSHVEVAIKTNMHDEQVNEHDAALDAAEQALADAHVQIEQLNERLAKIEAYFVGFDEPAIAAPPASPDAPSPEPLPAAPGPDVTLPLIAPNDGTTVSPMPSFAAGMRSMDSTGVATP